MKERQSGSGIVGCPRCGRRYRLPEKAVLSPGRKLRCTKCGHVFLLDSPSSPATVQPEGERVLVASDGEELRSLIEGVLLRGGYVTRSVGAGEEAWEEIRTWGPRATVLDVGLPGMPVFEVCDRIRKDPDHQDVAVVLLASVYQHTRYKRAPTSLYGADDYIEKHHLRDSLVDKIARLLSEKRATAPPKEGLPPAREETDRHRETPPSPEETGADEESLVSEEHSRPSGKPGTGTGVKEEALRRFARIIISDIALYNEKEVEEGIRRGTLHELLGKEIAEGRRLYRARLSPGAGVERGFFDHALEEFVNRQQGRFSGNRKPGEEKPPPMDVLREQLGDGNEEVRLLAVQSLAPRGEGALDLLGEALGDGSWRVRKAALELLVALPGTGKVEALLEGLRDEENAARRNTSMEALVRLGGSALPFLPSLLEDEDPDVRKFVVDILGGIEDVGVCGPLLKALGDREENVAAAAAEHLGRKKYAAALPALTARLEKGDFWVRYSCLRALGAIGDPAAGSAVLRAAEERDLRQAAVEALGRMGVAEAEPFILEGLLSEERGMRKSAVLAFARLAGRMQAEGRETGSLRENLRRNAGEGLENFLGGLTDQEDPELRGASMVVLGAAAGGRAIAPLLRALPSLGEEEQGLVAGILEALPEEDLQGLLPQTHSEEPDVRRLAATVLGKRVCVEALPRLVELLRDENGHVRSAAAGAAGRIGGEAAAAPLVALLDDPYPDVRQAAAKALKELGSRGGEMGRLVPSLLEPRLDSRGEEAAAAALRIVAALGGREITGRLKSALKDPRSRVRRAAVEALGSLEGADLPEALRPALTDEDPAVRRDALQVMGEGRRPGTLPLLLAMLGDEDLWVRVRAVQALARYRSVEARKALLGTVESETAGPVRLAAIRALGRAGGEEGKAMLLLLARAPDSEVRLAAVEALAHVGGGEVRDALLACLEDENWSLRSAAVKALAPSAGEEKVRSSLETVARQDGDPMVRNAAAEVLGTTAG